jgi:uncharacterized protein YnzC (UPF0291/DUF896 family)
MAAMERVDIDVDDIELVDPDGQSIGPTQLSRLQLVVLMRHRH